MNVEPLRYAGFLMDMGIRVLGYLTLTAFLVALIDLAYVRQDFQKRMRMSRRELRDEIKRREGDPQIRSKRRELQRALLRKSGAIRKVRDADVLITNPVHLAIALSYKRGEMQAPRVVSKGAGYLADTMKRIAKRYRVPVIENKSLARALYARVDVNGEIPEDVYPVVADILREIYATKRTAQSP